MLNPKLEAIKSFKDWSNYLLVTTVAAVGWVSTAGLSPGLKSWCIAFLTASVVFAIFTLALIPLVTEKIDDKTASFYDVKAEFNLVLDWLPMTLRLKYVCWPQHIFFLMGVILYSIGVV